MRFLYLDDSGKPHPQHPSRFVAFGGFSVDEVNWHTLVRQLSGAKARHFSKRGNPHDWEIKSRDYLTPNAWKRANNRAFCTEMASILRRNQCSVYVVYFDKSKATKPLAEDWIVPRCFQVLVAKFALELEWHQTTGTIVCDWSTHALDQHVSQCVQSFVVTQGLTSLIGGVNYSSSMAAGPVQICDLVAGAYRIFHEGGTRLAPFVQTLRALAWNRPSATDVFGRPWNSDIRLF